jgi:hypothetical protein
MSGSGRLAGAPVLVDDDLSQLLDRRLRRRLVECDGAVLDQVYAVAGREDLRVVVKRCEWLVEEDDVDVGDSP